MIDGERGTLVVAPGEATRAAAQVRDGARSGSGRRSPTSSSMRRPALPNGEAVTIMINVAEPDELSLLDPAICDGIGLVRTEFLFQRRDAAGRGDAVSRLSSASSSGRASGR